MNPLCESTEGFLLKEFIMKIVLLSDSFYADYADCREILHKTNRPYMCLLIRLYGKKFAIPVRHHIRHNYSFHTIGEAGLDYSKAIVVEKDDYILSKEVFIESREWAIIKRNENQIRYEFEKFLRQYKRALGHPENKRSQNILKYSALKYFEF